MKKEPLVLGPRDVFVTITTLRARKEVRRLLGSLPQSYYPEVGGKRTKARRATYHVFTDEQFDLISQIRGLRRVRIASEDYWYPSLGIAESRL